MQLIRIFTPRRHQQRPVRSVAGGSCGFLFNANLAGPPLDIMPKSLYAREFMRPTLDAPIGASGAIVADGAWHRHRYLSVRMKFAITLVVSLAWAVTSYLLAQHWIDELSLIVGDILAHLVIFGIAILPGFMNAFLVLGLLLDRRPRRAAITSFPGVTVLVAAYNEQDSILSTLASLDKQDYPAPLEVLVINDGSTDATGELLAGVRLSVAAA